MLEVLWPIDVEYVPAGQLVQALKFVEAPYVPAAQDVHELDPDCAEYCPITHALQLDDDDAPVVATAVPAGQLTQLDIAEAD